MKSGTGILLVNPYIHDFAAYNLWLRPFGLIDLYAYLSGKGVRVDYVDALFPVPEEMKKYGLTSPESKKYRTGEFPSSRIRKPDPYKNIPRHFKRFGIPPAALRERLGKISTPACILMTSGMTYWYPGVRETVKICRETFPGAPVILGGVYATLCPGHAGRYSGADIVLPGPWRRTLPEILRGEFGIEIFAGEGRFDLDPCEIKLYPHSGFGTVRAGKGCPLDCGYCACSVLDGDFLKFPVRAVYEEIVKKADSGCSDIAFYDDALLADADHFLVPLLELISSSGINCRFHTPNGLHARWMNKRIAGLFMDCNFRTVRLAFDRPGRSSSGVKASAEHLRRASSALREAGYAPGEIKVYTLIGLNGQKDDYILETFKIIRDSGMRISPAFYSPTPGTAFFDDDCRRVPELREEPLLHNSSVAALWNYDLRRYDRLRKIARGV